MLNGYPRPQLERKEWLNLNGEWQFLFDDEKRGEKEKWYEHFPEETGRIQVPYTYETKYSGIGEEKFHPVVWYHREIEIDRVENRSPNFRSGKMRKNPLYTDIRKLCNFNDFF